MGFMIMRRHVFLRGVVAAKGNATGLAGTQVQPMGVQPDAFLTDIFFGCLDVGDRGQMFAGICHGCKGKWKVHYSGQSREIFFSSNARMAVDFVMVMAFRKYACAAAFLPAC